jgi:hypothetical protein
MRNNAIKLTLLLGSALFIISTALTTSAVGSVTRKQQGSSNKQEKLKRADQAADQFIKQFHETLDFGVAFDEVAISDAIQRLRKNRFFQSLDLSDSLAEEIDDATARRLYKAFMNFYYLRVVYSASIKVGFVDIDRAPLPQDIRGALQHSHQLSNLLLTNSTDDPPKVMTMQELTQYITDLEQIAKLYKKHLPPDVFNSPIYKTNIKALEKERGRSLEIERGDDYFGVEDYTEVYVINRDIFTLYFIEKDGKMKLLGLSIDN